MIVLLRNIWIKCLIFPFIGTIEKGKEKNYENRDVEFTLCMDVWRWC